MKTSINNADAPKAEHILSQAIEFNGLVFVSGQIHSTPDGKLTEGTVSERFAQVMKNVSAILSAAGTSLDNVLKVTIYVTDISLLPEINAVYASYFAKDLPAREAVCVSALPLGATIEVSVIAGK